MSHYPKSPSLGQLTLNAVNSLLLSSYLGPASRTRRTAGASRPVCRASSERESCAGGGCMPLKTPLKEYEDFIATCPGWLRRSWLGQTPEPGDVEAYVTSDRERLTQLEDRFFNFLALLPKKRKEWERRVGRIITGGRVSTKLGRPRQDAKAEQIHCLRKQGKTFGQIAREVKSSDEEHPPSADSVRKLLASRRKKSTGEKSD